jgi:DNA-directed RNA polymerase beta' subunit
MSEIFSFLNAMDINKYIDNHNVLPVTNLSMYSNNGTEYTEDGLFSEKIFGSLNTADRKKKYGYIDLGVYIMNPIILNTLIKTEHKIKKIIKMESYYELDDDGLLIKSDELKGRTGMSFLKDILENGKLNLRPYNTKRDMFDTYLKNNMDKIWIDKWLVIPPDNRENMETDDYRATSELNNYYTGLIVLSNKKNRNDMLAWSIQNTVLNIYDYIKSKISKKHGFIRGSLMGKRVDFSGRAVIVSNYNLKLHEVGIPYEMLIKLFEPFLIHEMLNDDDFKLYSTLEMKKILDKVYNKTINNDKIKILLKKVIQDKVVLLKRDPALHRGSVQGFQPIFSHGDVIELHPAVVGPFNADFDGDSISGTKVKLEINYDNKTSIIIKDISQLSELQL